MTDKLYKIGIAVLGILIIFLFIAKINGMKESEIVETSYIGDMEKENEKKSVGEVDGKQNDGQDGVKNSDELVDSSIIRVLIKSDGFTRESHEEITLSAYSGLQITSEFGTEEYDSYTFTEKTEMGENKSIKITAINPEDKIRVESLERSYGIPEYYGIFELYKEDDKLILVNELELEKYLSGVLPSEMPASYELEALKAQAVCARSYAYTHMSTYNYPEYRAHVDDSTAYQVYNNLEENEICNQAINETTGEKLAVNGNVVTTYFFSTSCGYTTDVGAWGSEITADTAYLKGIEVSDGVKDYESELAWYRWKVNLEEEELIELLEKNLDEDIGELKGIEITKRGVGDIAICMEIQGSKKTMQVETENKIRTALGGDTYVIKRQDGSEVQGSTLLPSAFIEIEKNDEDYVIIGGGFGHGVGMSQNGANEMAKTGLDYKQILNKFYNNVEVVE